MDELQSQIRSYQQQIQQTEEKKPIEVVLKEDNFWQQIKQQAEQISFLKRENIALRTAFDSQSQTLKQFKLQHKTVKNDLSKLERTLEQVTHEKASKTNDPCDLHLDTIYKQQQEIFVLKNQHDELVAQNANLIQSIESLKGKHTMNQKLVVITHKLNTGIAAQFAFERKMGTLMQEIQQLKVQNKEQTTMIDMKNTRIRQLNSRIKSLESNDEMHKNEIAAMKEEIETRDDAIKALTLERSKLQEMDEQYKIELQSYKSQMQVQKKRLLEHTEQERLLHKELVGQLKEELLHMQAPKDAINVMSSSISIPTIKREDVVIKRLEWENQMLTKRLTSVYSSLYTLSDSRDVAERKLLQVADSLKQQHTCEMEENLKRISTLEHQVQILSEQISETNVQSTKIETFIHDLQAQKQDLSQEVERYQTILTRKELDHLRSIEMAEKRAYESVMLWKDEMKRYWDEDIRAVLAIGNHDEKTVQLTYQIHALKCTEKDLIAQVSGAQSTIDSLQAQVVELQAMQQRHVEMSSAHVQAPKKSLQAETFQLQNDLFSEKQKVFNLSKQIKESDEKCSQLSQQLASLHEALKMQQAQHDSTMNNELIKKEQVINNLENETTSYAQNAVEHSKKEKKLRFEAHTLRIQVEELSQELQSKDAVIDTLQKAIERIEKSNKGNGKSSVSHLLRIAKTAEADAQRKLRLALREEIELRTKLSKANDSKKVQNTGDIEILLIERDAEINYLKLKLAERLIQPSTIGKAKTPEKKIVFEDVTEPNNTQQQIKTLQDDLLNKQKQLDDARQDMKQQIEIVSRETEAKQSSIHELQDRINKATLAHDSIANKYTFLEEKHKDEVKKLSEMLDHYKQQCNELKLREQGLLVKLESQQTSELSVGKTMNSLQQEQFNVQRLMSLVATLRQQNEEMRNEVEERQALKYKTDELQQDVDKLLRHKKELAKRLIEAKEYIQQLLSERNHIKSELKDKLYKTENVIATKNKEILEMKEKIIRYEAQQDAQAQSFRQQKELLDAKIEQLEKSAKTKHEHSSAQQNDERLKLKESEHILRLALDKEQHRCKNLEQQLNQVKVR